jgi:hypothetical protein
MLVPAIITVVVLFFIIRFIVAAAKKKSQGKDFGDSGAGAPPIHQGGRS